ncbi:hypothetical protein TcasGA2_TC014845 [Tribolium castaneum]|uniref:C2H2-type domain-containing protein n=1 Tax=Tribolium castaneum TaxID=7070 RepID=D2A4E0_TRICA|nr:hypothetical protein TcasGA2_TC014845 [Tribolium castaneum]
MEQPHYFSTLVKKFYEIGVTDFDQLKNESVVQTATRYYASTPAKANLSMSFTPLNVDPILSIKCSPVDDVPLSEDTPYFELNKTHEDIEVPLGLSDLSFVKADEKRRLLPLGTKNVERILHTPVSWRKYDCCNFLEGKFAITKVVWKLIFEDDSIRSANMEHLTVAGNYQQIKSESVINIKIFSNEQLLVLQNSIDFNLYFDATGSVVRNQSDPKSTVYYYAGVVFTKNHRVCPVLEMVSSEHATNNIQDLFVRFINFCKESSMSKIPFETVVTDFSVASIQAFVNFVKQYNTKKRNLSTFKMILEDGWRMSAMMSKYTLDPLCSTANGLMVYWILTQLVSKQSKPLDNSRSFDHEKFIKEIQTLLIHFSDDMTNNCLICGKIELDHTVNWIRCNSCGRWFHTHHDDINTSQNLDSSKATFACFLCEKFFNIESSTHEIVKSHLRENALMKNVDYYVECKAMGKTYTVAKYYNYGIINVLSVEDYQDLHDQQWLSSMLIDQYLNLYYKVNCLTKTNQGS